MTCRCEFGVGNRGFARLAMGTVSGSNSLAEAAQVRIRRRQQKRTRCSTVSVVREGRARRRSAKTTTASHQKSNCGVASSVSRRPHVEKAIQGNLRDPMTSRVLNQQLLVLLTLVAKAISVSEGSGNALWGVGWVRSISDVGDSITPMERRNLACMHGCSLLMNESIPFFWVGGLA